MGVLSVCMTMHHECAVHLEVRRRCQIPQTGVTDGCEPIWVWGIQFGSSEELLVTESTLQPCAVITFLFFLLVF